MATIVNDRDVFLQAELVRLDDWDFLTNVHIDGTPVIQVRDEAAEAWDFQQRLEVSGSSVLKGVIVPTDSGALKTGSITWNSTTGALTGGTGIAMTEWGLIGAASGVATFTIESSTGDAWFAGELSAATGTFAGDLITSGDVVASGANQDTTTIWLGAAYHIDYSVYGEAASNASAGTRVRAGLLGRSTATTSQYNVGVIGDGPSATKGIGVAASGGLYGIYTYSASGNALYCNGTMAITSSTLVTNLNAEKWNGITTAGSTGNGSSAVTMPGSTKPGNDTTPTWLSITIGGVQGDILFWPRA